MKPDFIRNTCAMATAIVAFALPLFSANPARSAETVVAALELRDSLLPAGAVMTFVVDAPAGTEFPLHHHGGPGVATLLSGEITVTFADGSQQILHPGDVFNEPTGLVHAGLDTSDDTAQILWTLFLPEGAELETAD